MKFYFAVACLIYLVVIPVHAAKKTEASNASLDDLHTRIEGLKKELDDSKEAHKDAADALKGSEAAISQANRKLYDISKQQKKNAETLAELKKQSSNLNSILTEQQKLLGQQLYQQYLHGKQSHSQMILQSQMSSAFVRDLQYFSYVAKARAKLIQDMRGNLNRVAKLDTQTEAKLKEMLALKQEQEVERKELEKQKREKTKVVQSLAQKIASQRQEIKKLVRDEKRLSQLVERLAKISIKPIKKKLNVPKDESTSQIQHTPMTTNETLPTNEWQGVDFASLRGKLRLPVKGDIANRFGSKREESGISWKGMFIRATENSEVKSVASGRVVFADWLRGFGNLIIIDHGNSYMSLYGNNQAVLKNVGDEISGGDVIASVGNSGGNDANGLYYELRHQSKPFDPLSWSNLK